MSSCHIEPIKKPLDYKALKSSTIAYLPVQGIGCPRCVIRVHNSLLSLDGVLVCTFDESTAVVAYDPQRISPHMLVEAVAAAGKDGHHHYSAYIMFEAPMSKLWTHH